MSYLTGPHTSVTLLGLLRNPEDQRAWGEFAARYGGAIQSWCLAQGLQPSDADDVTQQLLAEIHRKIRKFRYDPGRGRFRDYLKVITRNACRDFFTRKPPSVAQGLLDNLPAREDFERELDQVEQEMEKQVNLERLREALGWVSQQVSERDWRIFQELAFEGRKGKDVARERAMKVAAVYVVSGRVKQKVMEKFLELGGSEREWEGQQP
jgi:RNA polymerase sigma factor (sigma-70 family)